MFAIPQCTWMHHIHQWVTTSFQDFLQPPKVVSLKLLAFIWGLNVKHYPINIILMCTKTSQSFKISQSPFIHLNMAVYRCSFH